MKIIYILFCLLFLSCPDRPHAMENTKPTNISDTILINYRSKIKFDSISVFWESFIIEETVEPEGSAGNQSVGLTIKFEKDGNQDLWQLLLPADYKEFIKSQPHEVTRNFQGYIFCITNADFDNIKKPFMLLNLTKMGNNTFYINDRQVTEQEFKKFTASLVEIEGTWYCAETTNGGEVGYDMKDKKGKLYQFRTSTENGVSTTTISDNKLPEE